MRNSKIALILLTFLLAWSGYAQIPFEDKVAQALNEGQWFELRKLYEAGNDSIEYPLLKLLTESYLGHVFNQPEDACIALDSLLMGHQDEMPLEMTMDLFFLKAANLSQMGFNKEAALTLSAVIDPMLPQLGADSLKRWLDKRNEYEAFSQFEKTNQIFIPHTDGIAPFRMDSIGEDDKRGFIIVLAKAVQPGNPYKNISGESTDGKELSLKSIIGKEGNRYVLLEFWATWCGPCMKEVPYLKEAYTKFRGKGFEIYSMSIDQEKEKNKWVQTIQEKGMEWTNVLRTDAKNTTEAYGVQSIPTNFLIDCSTGQIIATNLRGNALTMKLEELTGKEL